MTTPPTTVPSTARHARHGLLRCVVCDDDAKHQTVDCPHGAAMPPDAWLRDANLDNDCVEDCRGVWRHGLRRQLRRVRRIPSNDCDADCEGTPGLGLRGCLWVQDDDPTNDCEPQP